MKRRAYTIITFALVLSSFSFLGIAFMDHGVTKEKCPFSVLSSNDCETVVDASASLFHQISASQTLTEISPLSSISLLLSLFVILLVLFGTQANKSFDFVQFFERFRFQEKLSISILNPILRWIALHNKINSHLHLKKVVI